ncbi:MULTISPECIES: peptidoglycan-associated lipoprotein Pal [Colwellia]|uniref:Peptidoglycan-associated lipoprotein n=1 Tax=Colwellia psychrerythraea (strain 34H / ATCC BAA-681) TaxID=167879 RepID=Q484P5_COLP3|nr:MULTISPECIES: peptidoglycan-associated lipoprotein Pal [Colwellia]AAZ28818.1 peptidoglycan-associated lipoprotein [Colwellia psychrerythraea 34H]PKH89104.1 peptidoglycan-associated lipoprotein [Colwellia sp. Bg11-28]
MRFNNIVKCLAIALPLTILSACSSNSDTDEQSQVDTNAQITKNAEDAQKAQEAVQVTAAKRAAEIEEQKRQELAQLRSEHIIYFDFDVSNVNDQFSAILDAHAKFLNANSDVKVLIEGHADERGTPEYNIALGERRAKSVVTYLENMGVAAGQLTVVSYGEEKPMVKDRSENAFSKNRRAVLVY